MARRSKAQWRELILQQQSSGLSVTEFCRRESINPKYFSTRKSQLFESTSSFVELVPPSNKAIESHSKVVQLRVIELELPLDSLVGVLDQLRR